jgi:hypothetical protein
LVTLSLLPRRLARVRNFLPPTAFNPSTPSFLSVGRLNVAGVALELIPGRLANGLTTRANFCFCSARPSSGYPPPRFDPGTGASIGQRELTPLLPTKPAGQSIHCKVGRPQARTAQRCLPGRSYTPPYPWALLFASAALRWTSFPGLAATAFSCYAKSAPESGSLKLPSVHLDFGSTRPHSIQVHCCV